MSDKVIVVISIFLTIGLYPFYIIMMRKLRVKSNNKDRAVRAMEEGKSVPGKLVYVSLVPGNCSVSDDPGERSMHPDTWESCYEYIVDGKKYRQRYTESSDNVPKEVTMYYFPNNPKKAYSENYSIYRSKRKIGCITIFIWPTIFFVIVFHTVRLFYSWIK